MVRSNWFRVVFERSLIPLNSLLVFFLVFEPRIVLPQWLQVFGRMHPLFLHFPIVLVVLFTLLLLFFPSRFSREHWFLSSMKGLLLAAAITSSITALMGFALSLSEGYDAEALSLHKYSGVFVPFILHLLYVLRNKILHHSLTGRVVGLAVTALISLAGHEGAVITHGENFLFEPLTPKIVRELPPFEDAYVYADLVKPILDEKCVSCHNDKKSKGNLIMDTRELFLKGGDEGIPWDTTKEDLGVMMRRIHLPLEQKEHMPPKGKPQLTDEETLILEEWVKRGANFEQKLVELHPTDTLYVLGKVKLPSATEEKYDFDPVSESAVTALNNNYRVVVPIALESPALSATFYNRAAFKIDAVKELNGVKDNVVEINLSGMDVKDEDLAALAQFKNLRRLNLNFTSITGNSLEQLKVLPHLKELSLSGTSVEQSHLRALQDFTKLRSVYLWSTPAAGGKLDDLTERNKNITWNTGFKGDTLTMQLTPPLLDNEERIVDGSLDLKLKHYIRGTVVHYTLNGEEPDSVKSAVYKPGIKIDSNVTLKAKAFKPGWISSEVLEYHFYKRSVSPDSIRLLTKPHPRYAAKGGASLNDNDMSDLNGGSGKWLGFQDNRFDAVFRFAEPAKMKNITFSLYEDLGAWIFPPRSIEVYAGDNEGSMKLIKTFTPKQPTEMRPRKLTPLVCEFDLITARYIRIVAQPVKLPSWHPEKGKNGYIFVDELFIN